MAPLQDIINRRSFMKFLAAGSFGSTFLTESLLPHSLNRQAASNVYVAKNGSATANLEKVLVTIASPLSSAAMFLLSSLRSCELL